MASPAAGMEDWRPLHGGVSRGPEVRDNERGARDLGILHARSPAPALPSTILPEVEGETDVWAPHVLSGGKINGDLFVQIRPFV
jgi:hypothetical protein